MPGSSDRPTVPPLFDVAKYAKDSEARVATAVAIVVPTEPMDGAELQHAMHSEVRLITRPPPAAVSDEAWSLAMQGIPSVVMAPDMFKRLPLDHRAGFVVSLMDGGLDLETLVELSSMPREQVLRLVRDLYESGVVDFL